MHLRLDHIEGVGEKGRRNARRNTRGEVEKGNGHALVRIVDLHDVWLDGVVDADVQTRVRSISQDGGNQTREESPLVLLHHILAGVKDGVVRHLIVLHSSNQEEGECVPRLHKGHGEHNGGADRPSAETRAEGIQGLVIDVAAVQRNESHLRFSVGFVLQKYVKQVVIQTDTKRDANQTGGLHVSGKQKGQPIRPKNRELHAPCRSPCLFAAN